MFSSPTRAENEGSFLYAGSSIKRRGISEEDPGKGYSSHRILISSCFTAIPRSIHYSTSNPSREAMENRPREEEQAGKRSFIFSGSSKRLKTRNPLHHQIWAKSRDVTFNPAPESRSEDLQTQPSHNGSNSAQTNDPSPFSSFHDQVACCRIRSSHEEEESVVHCRSASLKANGDVPRLSLGIAGPPSVRKIQALQLPEREFLRCGLEN